MPKGKRKHSSIRTPLNVPGRKRPRYNLRSRNGTIISESDSNSSVIFVGSSLVSPRTATITKKNLRKRINQAKKTARKNANLSRYQSRRLINSFAQTDESFTCPSCGLQEDVATNEEKIIETIYTNVNYKENDVASTTSKYEETGHCCEDPTNTTVDEQGAVEKEPQQENATESSSTANNEEQSTARREENQQPLEDQPEDSSPQRETYSETEFIENITTSEQFQQEDDHHQEHQPSPFGAVSTSEPYFTPCGNFSFGEFASPTAFTSQVEFGLRLDDIPVSPIVPDDMCSGDGTHNDPLQVQVVDLGDATIEDYIQTESGNDSDDGPLI